MSARGATGAQVLARARVHDPLTSLRSAREMNDSGLARGQAAWFLDEVTREPGRTASELAAGSGGRYDRYQANRRLADLERAGLVAKGDSRRSEATGRPEVTWEPARAGPAVTPEGQVVLL